MLKSAGKPFTIFIFFILLSGSISLFLGQDVNEDLLNYHFYNGFALLHQRMNQDIAPAMMQTYLNPFFDAINYFLIALQKPMLTGFLLGTFSGFIAFVLYLIAKLLFVDVSTNDRVIYTILALAIGLTGAAGISLIGTTTNDTKMTLLILLSLYFLLKAVQQDHYLFLAGLCAGLVLGFKLIAAAYVMGLTVAVCTASFKKIPFFTALALGFLLSDGYWMFVLYKNFHSPIFPLYNNIFHSPYAPFISFNLPSATAETFKMNVADYLALPFYLAWKKNTFVSGVPVRDIRFAIILLLGIVFSVKQKITRNSDAWNVFVTFFIASYITWLIVLANYRYILPLEILSGLMIIYLLQNLLNSTFSIQIFLVLILLAMGATTYYPDWGHTSFKEKYISFSPPPLPPGAKIVLKTKSLAFVAPFFPASTQFIGMPFVDLGINVNDSKPAVRKLFVEVMNELTKDKFIYTLGFQKPDRHSARSVKILQQYGLLEDLTRCVKFETNLGNKLELCPLTANY